jgi:DNA modification methylase
MCVYGTRGNPALNPSMKNLTEILNQDVNSIGFYDDLMSIVQLWLVKRDNAADYEHPTQKPVTLGEKPLKRCSSPGQIVLDLFGGSGSTLIAAEQLKRKAYLIEVDPTFCDVIIKRYEHYTKQHAKKLN